MIHRAHSPVSVTSDKKGVHFIMNIDLHISAKSVFERKDIPGVIRLRDSSSFQETFLRLLDRWNEPDSAIRDMKVASLTTEIVSEIFEAFSSQRLLGDDAILTTYDAQGLKVNDGRFHQIIEYMERNPREQLTSEQMAVMAHLHPSAFSKAFKSVYGMTPKLMLRQVRLNQAKRLLEKESVTLEAIADECGFYDAAYFIRIFQKVFGQTPGEYRKRLKIFEGIKLLTS
jgi:AraC-like DNA-binding protein